MKGAKSTVGKVLGRKKSVVELSELSPFLMLSLVEAAKGNKVSSCEPERRAEADTDRFFFEGPARESRQDLARSSTSKAHSPRSPPEPPPAPPHHRSPAR